MASQKWDDHPEIIQLTGSALNGLGPGVSYLTDEIIQSEARQVQYIYRRVASRLDLFADFELTVRYFDHLPAVGDKVAELYLDPQLDGLNYAVPPLPNRYYRTGGPTYPNQNSIMLGAFDSFQPSFTVVERLHLRGVLLPPRSFRLLLRNAHTQAYGATGIALALRTYRLQVA